MGDPPGILGQERRRGRQLNTACQKEEWETLFLWLPREMERPAESD